MEGSCILLQFLSECKLFSEGGSGICCKIMENLGFH